MLETIAIIVGVSKRGGGGGQEGVFIYTTETPICRRTWFYVGLNPLDVQGFSCAHNHVHAYANTSIDFNCRWVRTCIPTITWPPPEANHSYACERGIFNYIFPGNLVNICVCVLSHAHLNEIPKCFYFNTLNNPDVMMKSWVSSTQ